VIKQSVVYCFATDSVSNAVVLETVCVGKYSGDWHH
jgi:hypothetical protein